MFNLPASNQTFEADLVEAAVDAQKAEHLFGPDHDFCLNCARSAKDIREHRLHCIPGIEALL